jgi:hypothetical protein
VQAVGVAEWNGRKILRFPIEYSGWHPSLPSFTSTTTLLFFSVYFWCFFNVLDLLAMVVMDEGKQLFTKNRQKIICFTRKIINWKHFIMKIFKKIHRKIFEHFSFN